jgi:hypothetical protein
MWNEWENGSYQNMLGSSHLEEGDEDGRYLRVGYVFSVVRRVNLGTKYRVKIGRGVFRKYRLSPVSTGNTFQDLPRLRETTGNTERYI